MNKINDRYSESLGFKIWRGVSVVFLFFVILASSLILANMPKSQSQAPLEAEAASININPNLKLTTYDPNVHTEIKIIVAFITYTGDAVRTFSQGDIDNVMLYFNDNNPSNGIISLNEYYNQASRGRVSVKATYATYATNKSYSYYLNDVPSNQVLTVESDLFKNAVAGKTFQIDDTNVNEINCRVLYMAGNSSSDASGMMWPHSFLTQNIVLFPQRVYIGSTPTDGPFPGVIAHEFGHVLGLGDLYTRNSTRPVGSVFIMANTDYYEPQSMNAYYKEQVGWFEDSHALDKIDTEIDLVESSGQYELNGSNSSTGTVAYRFGYNTAKTEYFVAEYRKGSTDNNQIDYGLSSSEQGVVVYRVNTNVRGNLDFVDSSDHDKLEVFVFRRDGSLTNDTTAYLNMVGHSLGNSSVNKLKYSDGTDSGITVALDGYNAGRAVVNITLVSEKFAVSGIIEHEELALSGVQVFTQIPGALTPTNTGVVTDASGYYFVSGLPANTKITFSKAGTPIPHMFTLTSDNLSADVSLYSEYLITVTTKIGAVVTSGVKAYKGQTLLGTSDAGGHITLTLKMYEEVCFIKDAHYFPIFQFVNVWESNFDVVGQADAGGTLGAYAYIELYNFETDAALDGSLALYARVNGQLRYFVLSAGKLKIEAANGDKLSLYFLDYAMEEKTIVDIATTVNVYIRPYHTVVFNFIDFDNAVVSGVKVWKNGEELGVSDASGNASIKVALGETLEFTHATFEFDPYTYTDLETNVQIKTQPNGVEMIVRLVNYNNVKVDVPGVVVRRNGILVSYSVLPDGRLRVFARMGQVVTFEKAGYVFGNYTVSSLAANQEKYVSAKKIISVLGRIQFPDDVPLQEVKIFLNGTQVGATNAAGEFSLMDILEGDLISFETEGFVIREYRAVNSNSNLVLAADYPTTFNYIWLIAIGGFLFFAIIGPYIFKKKRR